MRFSIITASFNPGEKLLFTINSILEQEFQDFEIIVKDGGSTDGAVEKLQQENVVQKAIAEQKLKLIIRLDENVYDGMNQAIDVCLGEFILFLNCGDRFHDNKVLERTAKIVDTEMDSEAGGKTDALNDNIENKPVIYYGNTYCMRTGSMVHSSPEITGFTCYRNIPCHQSCFYDRRLFQEKKYDINLKIRADYDHFLWCFYRGGVEFRYMDLTVADYEGGGISETKENRKTDRAEHELVIKRYMKTGEIIKYKGIMLLTLAPFRRWIAESSSFSGIYHRIKGWLYHKADA